MVVETTPEASRAHDNAASTAKIARSRLRGRAARGQVMSSARLSLHVPEPSASRRLLICLLTFVSAATLAQPAWAYHKEPTVAVDLELVIAVDVSTSMSPEEQHVQREGYVSALRSPDVMRAIKSGRLGRIAIAYVEWARPEYQRVVAPWTVIEGPADAAALADVIAAQPSLPQGGTSISAGLLAAGRLLRTSVLSSNRQVVDVSGDGPNNAGPPIESTRDVLITSGVTINGLAISLAGGAQGMIESFNLDYLVSYYKRCVIGGAGAFVLAVGDLADFERAIRRKMVDEIAGAPARLQFAADDGRYPPVVDCRTLRHFPFLPFR
jgi:hypothetical protein